MDLDAEERLMTLTIAVMIASEQAQIKMAYQWMISIIVSHDFKTADELKEFLTGLVDKTWNHLELGSGMMKETLLEVEPGYRFHNEPDPGGI